MIININVNKTVKRNNNPELVLSGQGDSYERLKQLNERERERAAIGNPNDSSTPAKMTLAQQHQQQQQDMDIMDRESRPTIQQLAQLVMNSARWRNPAGNNLDNMRKTLNLRPEPNGNFFTIIL